VRIHRASGTRWHERAITWRHMPRAAHRAVLSGPLHKDAWTAVDVTSLLTGSRVLDLALTGRGSDDAIIRSKESGFTAPRLVVDYSGVAAPTAPRPAPRPVAPPVPAPPAPTPGIAPTAAKPCGVASAPPAGGWQHVVWIVMENTNSSSVIGSSSAPYINSIAGKCGLATNFFAEAHPSLPNYIAMTSGSTQGISDDSGPSSHKLNVPSIFSQLGPGGWRSLEESMPSNCAQGDSGKYAVRHNPAAYYTNISSQCAGQDVPLADPPDLSAKFTFITPNTCDDMHDCSTQTGDTWLSQWVPKLIASPQYQAGNTIVFLTWDEDDGSSSNHIATLVMSPSTPPGTKGATQFNHYSMLRTTEEALGLPPIAGAAGAATMKADFNL
jgi:phosphatidylinositol-3-phosphatase